MLMANKKKRRFEQFLFYDYKGIEDHLQRMAEKGWQINKITNFYWEYRRIEPQKLIYAVTYFSEASEFNPYPTENQQTFHEYCKNVGWELVAEWAQMQVFCTDKENPIPIETDESVKLKAIHRAMKKNFLPSSILLIILALFQISLQIQMFVNRPVDFLSSNTGFCAAALWSVFAIFMLVSLAGYTVWYFKSKKAVKMGARCIERSSSYKRISYFFLVLTILIAAMTMFSLLALPYGWIGMFGIINVTVVIILAHTVKNFLKRAEVARSVNLTITIISCVVFSFVMMGIMAWVIVQGDNAGWIGDQPYDTYIDTMPDGTPWKREVYKDEIPLKIEDLQNIEYEYYSYRWEVEKSIVLAHYVGRQSSFRFSDRVPELRYEIVDVKLPVLFDLCLNEYLDRYNDEWREPGTKGRNWRDINDIAWQADQVYQLYYEDDPSAIYIVCWGSRIVQITFEEIPSAEQIAIAGERLRK